MTRKNGFNRGLCKELACAEAKSDTPKWLILLVKIYGGDCEVLKIKALINGPVCVIQQSGRVPACYLAGSDCGSEVKFWCGS